VWGKKMCERMDWDRLLVEKRFRVLEAGARDFIEVV
jgi:hypothetical protein